MRLKMRECDSKLTPSKIKKIKISKIKTRVVREE